MRGREFLMNIYIHSLEMKKSTPLSMKTKQAYTNVFRRRVSVERTFLTFASGGSFAKYSHEFQTRD